MLCCPSGSACSVLTPPENANSFEIHGRMQCVQVCVFWRFNPRHIHCGKLVVRKEPSNIPAAGAVNPQLGQSKYDSWTRFVMEKPDEAADAWAVTWIDLRICHNYIISIINRN